MLLNERYKIIRQLGRGASGIGFLAQDQLHQDGEALQKVVVKRFFNHHQREKASWEREASVLIGLSHPNIPSYIDHFQYTDEMGVVYPCLVQEFVGGISLAQECKNRKYTPTDVLEIGAKTLSIVAYLQSLAPAVMHRDINPSNLIRNERGDWSLIDFGTASNAVQRTFGHTIAVGTLGYQAPEQIKGAPLPASDVYSIGVVVLKLLSGLEPKDLLSWDHSLRWQSKVSHLPTEIKGWLEKMLAPVDKRYSSAAKALSALLPFLPPRLQFDIPKPSFEDMAQRREYDEVLQSEYRKTEKLTDSAQSTTDWLDVAHSWQRLHEQDRVRQCVREIERLCRDNALIEQIEVLEQTVRQLGFLDVPNEWINTLIGLVRGVRDAERLRTCLENIGKSKEAQEVYKRLQKEYESRVLKCAATLQSIGVVAPAPQKPYTFQNVRVHEEFVHTQKEWHEKARSLEQSCLFFGMPEKKWDKPYNSKQISEMIDVLRRQEQLQMKVQALQKRGEEIKARLPTTTRPYSVEKVSHLNAIFSEQALRHRDWSGKIRRLADLCSWAPTIPQLDCDEQTEQNFVETCAKQMAFAQELRTQATELQQDTGWEVPMPSFPIAQEQFEKKRAEWTEQSQLHVLFTEHWALLEAEGRHVLGLLKAPYDKEAVDEFVEECAYFYEQQKLQRATTRRSIWILVALIGLLLGFVVYLYSGVL